MSSSRTTSIIVIAAAAFLSAGAEAQAQGMLEGIVIESAGLAPVEADKAGSSYTVITGEEMQRRQIVHAADALRSVPGVNVSQAGSSGSLTQVRIRGAEGNHTKVLIDGVEVGTMDEGGFDFSTLLAADIERIEVLRGPQSGVYGANALAGVINIISKKGTGAPSVSISGEGGSMNTRALTANASGGSERGYLSVTASRRQTDGFNIATSGSEKDGSEQQNIFARGGVALTDNFRVDAMLRHQTNTANIDADRNGDGIVDDVRNYVDTRRQTLARVSAELDTFDKHWSHKVFADYFKDAFKDELKGDPFGLYTNEGQRGHWGYESRINFETPAFLQAKHTITGLVERKNESFEFASAFSEGAAKRQQTGFAAEYRVELLNRLTLTGNVRHDDNSTFADADTWRGAAAYTVPDWGTRFHASYGKGIKNPDFFELYGYTLSFHGNPNLKPEESLGWDAGVEQKFWDGKIVTDVTYFEADLTDNITGAGLSVVNLAGKSQRQGIETQITLKPAAGLSITGSYTYTDTRDPEGQQEIRRPRHSGGLNAAYTFADGRATISGGAMYNGEMKDERVFWWPLPVQRVTLGDYWLLNAAASYKLDERFTVFGRVENLLDQKYQEVFSYNGAPLAAYAGVKMTFQADAPLDPVK
jgi:vitamin B12 transporter